MKKPLIVPRPVPNPLLPVYGSDEFKAAYDAELTRFDGYAPEFCICAAIRMPDGEVIHGHRHNHCYDVVRARTDVLREDIVRADQGFKTSRGRFVDRKEAMIIQVASGRPSCYRAGGAYFGKELFSEDLY